MEAGYLTLEQSFIALLGAVFGSFFNVIIHRVPLMMTQENCHRYNVFFPRSHCPKCHAFLCWYHNIPVVSWLCLGGKCHACKNKISIRYPLVELFFMLVAVSAFCSGRDIVHVVFSLFFCGMLFSLALIDLRHTVLPDMLTLPLLWGGLLFHALCGEDGAVLQDAIFGAMAGYLVLWLVYWIFYALTAREGIGGGDYKLLAALGAWSGWAMLPAILLISATAGIIMLLAARILKQKKLRDEIPFGPSLAIAGVIVHFF